MKYIKLFDEHSQYESYTADTSGFILPNVSYCIDTPSEVHYNPLVCDETSIYDIIGSPSYPSTIEGDITFFDILVNYQRTDISSSCTETVTEGTDTIRVECGQNPSTSDSRVVSGTVEWNGNEIEYSVTQSKFEIIVIGNFNVTYTNYPTRIASGTTSFSKIEIDGVKQPRVVNEYTFDTLGSHTVKYYLKTTNIYYDSFRSCDSLTSCTIGSGVTSIGDGVFSSCTGLTSVTIPDSVTSIDNSVFSYCTSLTSVTIPDSVTSIGNYAFNYCSGLTSIDIPDSVTSIGNSAFHYCSGLTSCTIGSGVTSISNGTFWLCRNLKRINSYIDGTFNIPSGITSIGDTAFCGCYALKNINILDNVTSIGDGAFEGCRSLTSIDIPDSVTYIDSNAFAQCSGLTSVTIPNSVTNIGSQAFYECYSLTSCTIGSGVTSIGQNAFMDCSGLTSITSNATTAPTIQDRTFQGIKRNGTLYVPQGSSGYDVWMQNTSYYLRYYNWTKVER